MIVEMHRDSLDLLFGSIICCKNKPNKLKKPPSRLFIFLKFNLQMI